MTISAGIDVGSSAVKAAVVETSPDGTRLLAQALRRIRRREMAEIALEALADARTRAGVDRVDYIATTGEGQDLEVATGHFYGMTAHARGALFLDPRVRAVLDAGALHARAVSMDPSGRVHSTKMTSQCASGSGQFLENISRYLGVTREELGPLSLASTKPEKISSICAVLAETDVINMVSRGVATADILRGIHESMAGRFGQLLRSLGVEGTALVTGGLAADEGLLAALNDELRTGRKGAVALQAVVHPLSVYAGAIGAAIWGGVRHARVGGVAWTASATA